MGVGMLAELQEATKTHNPDDIFDVKQTGAPYYDGMIENPKYYEEEKGKRFYIKRITPAQYFEALEAFGRGVKGIERQVVQDKLVNRYADEMAGGKKYNVPYIEIEYTDTTYFGRTQEPYVSISQEGRHRAAAAEQLGAKTMPVMVIVPTDKKQYNFVAQKMPDFLK